MNTIEIFRSSCRNSINAKPEARLMDIREYTALQKDLPLTDLAGDDPLLYLFSRSGFTERLSDIALKQQPPQLHLISLEDLYGFDCHFDDHFDDHFDCHYDDHRIEPQGM